MNINAKWMNSWEDEGLMKWLGDIMSDWLIGQCWKFKWKSTHRREFMWLFCDLCSLEHILCKNRDDKEVGNFFWLVFWSLSSDFGTNLIENSVSGDLERRNNIYMSLGMWNVTSRVEQCGRRSGTDQAAFSFLGETREPPCLATRCCSPEKKMVMLVQLPRHGKKRFDLESVGGCWRRCRLQSSGEGTRRGSWKEHAAWSKSKCCFNAELHSPSVRTTTFIHVTGYAMRQPPAEPLRHGGSLCVRVSYQSTLGRRKISDYEVLSSDLQVKIVYYLVNMSIRCFYLLEDTSWEKKRNGEIHGRSFPQIQTSWVSYVTNLRNQSYQLARCGFSCHCSSCELFSSLNMYFWITPILQHSIV